MKHQLAVIGAGALLMSAGLFGCNPNGKTDTAAEQGAVNAANRTGEAAKNAGNTAGNVMSDMAKDATAAMVVTPKVSGALKADPVVSSPGNVINVDSKDNVVHLKGTVETNDIKLRAGKIAQQALNENHSTDRLSNELMVNKH